MSGTSIKVSLNCEISIQISQEELTHYKELAKSPGLDEVAKGLIDLAQVIQSQPLEQWVEQHRQFQAIEPKGHYADDKPDAFVRDGVYRALKIAYALQSQEYSVRLLSMLGALRADALLPLNYQVTQMHCAVSQS